MCRGIGHSRVANFRVLRTRKLTRDYSLAASRPPIKALTGGNVAAAGCFLQKRAEKCLISAVSRCFRGFRRFQESDEVHCGVSAGMPAVDSRQPAVDSRLPPRFPSSQTRERADFEKQRESVISRLEAGNVPFSWNSKSALSSA